MNPENLNNWVSEETVTEYKKKALKLAKERKEWEKGRKFKAIPHPTIPRTFIIKEIK